MKPNFVFFIFPLGFWVFFGGYLGYWAIQFFLPGENRGSFFLVLDEIFLGAQGIFWFKFGAIFLFFFFFLGAYVNRIFKKEKKTHFAHFPRNLLKSYFLTLGGVGRRFFLRKKTKYYLWNLGYFYWEKHIFPPLGAGGKKARLKKWGDGFFPAGENFFAPGGFKKGGHFKFGGVWFLGVLIEGA